MKNKPQFVTFTGNVNGATLKRKQLKGKDYLVGPVIMAREIVMNSLMYKANELKASVPHWNGCPAVLSHPMDADGNFLSANSPDIIEDSGVGFVYNTKLDSQNRLCAELWIEEDSLTTHTKLKTAIDEGEVIEVSTGLYYTPMAGNGTFKTRKYKALACNIKPDHLAILLNEKGACSVEDGAGFPRANHAEILEVNALSGGEISSLVAKALKKTYKINGWTPWLVDIYAEEKYVIFERYSAEIETYDLFKVSYAVNADETEVTFTSEPKRVMCKKNYVDIVDESMIKKSPTAEDGKDEDEEDNSKTTNGETTMNKAKIIAEMLASNKIDANKAKVLEGLTDEQFAVYQELQPTTTPEVPKTEEGGKNAVVPPVTATTPVVEKSAVNEADADKETWMQNQYQARREEFIAKITANKQNAFTAEELGKMSINALEKMSKLIVPTVDMAGALTPAPKTTTAKNAQEVKITPYVNE